MSKMNVILYLKVGEGWIEGVSKTQQYVFFCFFNIFKEPLTYRHHLDEVVLHSLFDEDNLSVTVFLLLP